MSDLTDEGIPPLLDRRLNNIKPDQRPLADIFAAAEKPIDQLINEEYDAARADMFSALKHAVACGKHLLEAKAQCEARKESWDNWRKSKTKLSQTTASLYMRLAEHQSAISKALANDPQLSITKAIKLLPKAKPRGATKPGGSSEKPGDNAGDKPPTSPSPITKEPSRDLVAEAKAIVDQLKPEQLNELAKYIVGKGKAKA